MIEWFESDHVSFVDYSVTMVLDIPDSINGSFYRGQMCMLAVKRPGT